jgi:hypothetical protein
LSRELKYFEANKSWKICALVFKKTMFANLTLVFLYLKIDFFVITNTQYSNVIITKERSGGYQTVPKDAHDIFDMFQAFQTTNRE